MHHLTATYSTARGGEFTFQKQHEDKGETLPSLALRHSRNMPRLYPDLGKPVRITLEREGSSYSLELHRFDLMPEALEFDLARDQRATGPDPDMARAVRREDEDRGVYRAFP